MNSGPTKMELMHTVLTVLTGVIAAIGTFAE